MTNLTADDRGDIGSAVLDCIATHGTCSPYWGPSNLIWIAQELVRKRKDIERLSRRIAYIEGAVVESRNV